MGGLRLWRVEIGLVAICVLLLPLFVGCPGGTASGNNDEGRTRINNLFHLFKAYTERNKKGPPDEQSLRDFGTKLTAEERASYIIPDDIDSLFISPRDKQKYVIRFNSKLDPTGPPRGIIWEAQGKGGTRFVALAVGYVEEYDETMVKDYIK